MPLQLYKMIFTKGNIKSIVLIEGYHGNQDSVELAFFICLHYQNATLWSWIASHNLYINEIKLYLLRVR